MTFKKISIIKGDNNWSQKNFLNLLFKIQFVLEKDSYTTRSI